MCVYTYVCIREAETAQDLLTRSDAGGLDLYTKWADRQVWKEIARVNTGYLREEGMKGYDSGKVAEP